MYSYMVTNNAKISNFDIEGIMTIYRAKGKKYDAWRQVVHQRDNYLCQHCKTSENIIAHHIIPWKESFELRIEVSNGLTLCKSCHMRHHATGRSVNFGRTAWNKGLKGISTGTPKGTKFSVEHRKKLSAAKQKNPKTAEHCKKLSFERLGKSLSAEHRAKLSEKTRLYWEKKKLNK